MSRRLMLAVGAVVLTATACGTSTDEATTPPAAVTTITAPVGTSAVAPSPTTTTTMEEVAAPAASEPLTMPAYLAASYRLDGWFTESIIQATINSTPTDVLGVQAEIYDEYLTVLRSLEPPVAAADYHRQLLELMERAGDTTRRAADAVGSGDSDAVLQAAEELIVLGEEMVAAGFAIALVQKGLVEELLAGREDPESVYILELLALQSSEDTQATQSLLARATSADFTIDELANLYRDVVGLFGVTLADYRGLNPPDSWRSLYDRQIELLEDGIVLYAAIADGIETGLEPELSLLLDLIDFAERGPALTGEVSEKMATYFESLEGLG